MKAIKKINKKIDYLDYLEFGGFYNTVHDDLITSYLEQLLDIDIESDSSEEIYNKIDFKTIYQDYAYLYFNEFCDFYKDFNFFDLEFIKLWKPDYYNSFNDSIELRINKINISKIITFLHSKNIEIEAKDNDITNLLYLLSNYFNNLVNFDFNFLFYNKLEISYYK